MKKKIILIAVSLLACSFSQAQAAVEEVVFPDVYASAYADITWSGLKVSSTGTYILYNDFEALSLARTDSAWHEDYDAWNPLALGWSSEVKTPTNSDATTNFTSAVSSISNGSYDVASSLAKTPATAISASLASVESRSDVGLVPGDYGQYTAVARAKTGQAYEVTASGTFSFQVPYFVDATTVGGGGDSTYAAAYAWSWLRLYNWDTKLWDEIGGTYAENTIGGYLNISYFADITGYTSEKAMYIQLEAGTDTIASMVKPVPVPPSVLMLLTGCTSLFFLKRRKS